jgi:flavin-dependent dehydrogenase
MDVGDFPLVGTDLIQNGVALGYGPRRILLDTILVDAAVDAGAEFRPAFLVEDYIKDGATIAGIRGRSLQKGEKIFGERARIMVGADGRHSLLARAVSAPAYETTPPLACWYFSYWSGVTVQGLEIYIRDRTVIFTFPTNDRLTAVFIGWPVSEFDRVRSGIEASFMKVLGSVPDLAERLQNGRREERFYGAADVPNFFRKPYGPGWALVGDAGVHKDPFLALAFAMLSAMRSCSPRLSMKAYQVRGQ